MTNREKFASEIIESLISNAVTGNCSKCKKLAIKKNNKTCHKEVCWFCDVLFKEWLEQEYEEPQIDWAKVPVDTKVLVSEDGQNWFRRHFAKYENREVYCFTDGTTSWSNIVSIKTWKYTKLAEDVEGETQNEKI